jgi:hypothetical protein
MLVGALGLVALLLAGAAVQAGETVIPFHAALKVVEDCETSVNAGNPSDQCLGFQAWLAACQAQGYNWAFQDLRTGQATLMGQVTSFEQGCLHFSGPGGLARSYVQLTITARNGDTLTQFAAGVFDFAQANPPATGTFSITGGTGRFAGARGSGTTGNVTGGGNPGLIIYEDGSLRLSGGHH